MRLRIRRSGDAAPYYEGEQNHVQFMSSIDVCWVEVEGEELTVTTDEVCEVESIEKVGGVVPNGVRLHAKAS